MNVAKDNSILGDETSKQKKKKRKKANKQIQREKTVREKEQRRSVETKARDKQTPEPNNKIQRRGF